jgi:hypothetical protein
MCPEICISSESAASNAHTKSLATVLCIAAVANALVPTVLFCDARLFGDSSPHNRALIAIIVVIEYAIGLLLLILKANSDFASGYLVASSAIAALAYVIVALATVEPTAWGWNNLHAIVFVLGGFAFAVSSNIFLLVASARYSRAMNPRLHVVFSLGIVTSLAVLFLWSSILD